MLILSETSIKTTLALLLFTTGCTYLSAAGTVSKIQTDNRTKEIITEMQQVRSDFQESIFTVSEDTIKPVAPDGNKEILPQTEFIVPKQFTGQLLDFQVNADITYRNFSHFVKNESKKLFFQAWLKEKELSRISTKADSLRKAYASSPNEQKEEIAALILKNEAQVITLNQEIPALYQAAREAEARYWQSATSDEISRFKEKIRLFNDSITLSADKLKTQTQQAQAPRDTIILYSASPKVQEIKTATNTGIIYKIQIGAYKGKTPELAAKLIKKLSVIRKIENYKDEKGVNVYTTGNLKSYQEAVTMQSQVKQEGAKNAIVAAYQNGKRITVAEARKINNEL